jgi:hypothetical protein
MRTPTAILTLLASLLSSVKLTEGTIQQERMGTLFSPVEYGRIHFIHDADKLDKLKESYDKLLDRELDYLTNQTNMESNGERAKRFLWRAKAHLQRLQSEWKEEVELLSRHTRPKRQLLAIAGVASGLFSLGLGIKNQEELEALRQVTETLDDNQQLLLHSLGKLQAETVAEFKELNQRLSWSEYQSRVDFLASHAKAHLRLASHEWINGAYLLLRGQLDSTVISPHELAEGKRLLAEKCRRAGLQMAQIDNELEILFSLPVTATLEDGRIQVWVSVPVIQENSPVFDLLRLAHVPIPFEDYMVELAPRDAYLAVDASRRLHADISASELAACAQHRRFYFCSRTTFSTQEDSCAVALLKGDGSKAGQLCHKYVFKAPAVVTTIANHSSGSRHVEVFTGAPVPVMRICPRGKDQPTVVVKGRESLSLPAGCHLRAGGRAIFVPTRPEDVILAAQGETWEAEDFLDGLAAQDVIAAIKEYNGTHGRVPLPELARVRDAQRVSSLFVILVVGVAFVVFVTFDLLLRYGFLCKDKCSVAKSAEIRQS